MATPFTLALLTALTIAPMAAIPQAPVSAPDVRVVVEAERAFAALAQVKGIRGSFVDSFSTDSVMISGRPSNAQEGFKTWSDGPENLTWYPQAAGISASGDLGFTYGPSVLREKADATILRHSTYISIWRRQPDGIWKVELDAGVAMPNPTNPIPGWASGNMVAKGPTPPGQAEASLRHAEALL